MATAGWDGESSARPPRSVVDGSDLKTAVASQQAPIQSAAVTLIDELAVIAGLAACHTREPKLAVQSCPSGAARHSSIM